MDAPLGPDSTPDSEAGPKGLLMQVDKLVRWGLVAKLLMRAFSSYSDFMYTRIGFKLTSV